MRFPSADPAAMLAALRAGDRPAALEAALEAYFGPAVRPKPPNLPPPLASLFTRLEPGLVRQNRLAIPTRESRVFCIENQSCNHWALGDDSDDPPVVRDGTVTEPERLCGFAIQLVLFEASMGCLHWSAGGYIAAGKRAPSLSGLSEVPLRPWTWPQQEMRVYVAPGIVAHMHGREGEERWVFASATTEEALLALARENDVKWTGIEAAKRALSDSEIGREDGVQGRSDSETSLSESKTRH